MKKAVNYPKYLNILLTQKQYAYLVAAACATNKSLSEYVRDLIVEDMPEPPEYECQCEGCGGAATPPEPEMDNHLLTPWGE